MSLGTQLWARLDAPTGPKPDANPLPHLLVLIFFHLYHSVLTFYPTHFNHRLARFAFLSCFLGGNSTTNLSVE